jgi:hypothetical protein
VLRIFIVRFEPANLGSNGKHANNYITEATEDNITMDPGKMGCLDRR